MPSDNVEFLFKAAMAQEAAAPEAAKQLYHQLLKEYPSHAAANINLGTIYYNQHDYGKAEMYYRLAIVADCGYSLAHFDLGNVLDETGRSAEAIEQYLVALKLAPTYADVHYNIALCYEKRQEYRKALKHWRAYMKLDVNGAWHDHAAVQAKKCLGTTGVHLVHSISNPQRKPGRAALELVVDNTKPDAPLFDDEGPSAA